VDLYNMLVDFSTNNPATAPKSKSPIINYGRGLGYYEWTWPIVEDVVTRRLHGEELDNMMKSNANLGMVVGSAVDTHTREDFSWSKVHKILETDRITIGLILFFDLEYPHAISKFSINANLSLQSYNMKRLCRYLAKAALFIEVVSFLESQDYAKLLKA